MYTYFNADILLWAQPEQLGLEKVRNAYMYS
jgi:hypothetical protein